jgi:energy-coupling factor transporter ATP-binding protein EcfA2
VKVRIISQYDKWIPIFPEDYKMDFQYDPLEFIRHKVFRMNEAWDIRVLGFKGGGKSTLALSLLQLLNPKISHMHPEKVMDKYWAFTTEERGEKKEKLRRGDVLVTDEQGTRKSGSSYKYKSLENQILADQRQLDRVDGVLEIGITLDEMRVMKRLRDIYRVDIRPETKLSNEDNNNMGMGIDCIMREITDNAFGQDSDDYKMKYFNYCDGGRIARITIPLPSVPLWNAYMKKRKEFKDNIEDVDMPETKRPLGDSYENVKKKIYAKKVV